MDRPKLSRLWSKSKYFFRSRLPSFLLTSRPTSTLRQSTQLFTPSQSDEKYQRIVKVTARQGEDSPWSKEETDAVALFDTGSQHNLVTSRFLKSIRFKWEPSTSPASIFQMDDTEIKILGEIEVRWYPLDAPSNDNFRPRYEFSTCKVVDLENFDLIIGRDEINRLGLFQLNHSIFGGFRGPRILVDPASVTPEKQQELEQKKQKEQEKMKKIQEERARKAKAPDPQAR